MAALTSNTVNLCLEEIERLKRERDRAIGQRAGYESHLWFAESLIKQFVQLTPRLIAATPADGVARDSLVEQGDEFIREERHHPTISALPVAAAGHDDLQQGNFGQSGTTFPGGDAA